MSDEALNGRDWKAKLHAENQRQGSGYQRRRQGEDWSATVGGVVEASAALGSASELVVLVFEQDVERRERSVTARDVLLQLELVRIAQLVARVYLLLENSRIPSEKHAEYCRAEYESEYNHT